VAPLVVAEAANAVMQQQDGGGVILNIGSLSGVRPSPGTVAYGAAKAGLLEATRALAIEWAPKVRVNAVTPGAIGTDELVEQYGQAYIDEISASIPMGRVATPTEVAAVCRSLLVDEAAYVTGANVLVHGGGDVPPDPTSA